MSKAYVVNLWTTFNCNFRCRYCYEGGLHRGQNMDKETADRFVDFLKVDLEKSKFSSLIINFHGGEPLLNFPIIEHIVERVINEVNSNTLFGITTNGSLITTDIIAFLKKHFSFDVSISIDGNESTHNFNRRCVSGSISHKTIIEHALKMKEDITNLRIRMTFDRYTARNLSHDIIYLYELGFKNIAPVADFCSREWTQADFDIVCKQLSKVKAYLKQKGDSDSIYLVSDDFQTLSKCTAGHGYYSISPNGEIYPCTMLVGNNKFIIGNLEDGLDKMKLSRIDEINNSKQIICKDCDLRDYCVSARCKLVNYFTNMNYYSPNLVQCNMLNIKYQLATNEFQNK